MLTLGLLAISCGEGGGGTSSPASSQPSRAREEILWDRAAKVFASVPDASDAYPDNLISSSDLKQTLEDRDKAAGIYLLDTRPRVEWDSQGHIAGANWVRMQEVAEDETLNNLPHDKVIVCVSSTGHTAAQVATILRWLGYDAVALEFGMAGWTDTPARRIIVSDVQGGMANKYPALAPHEITTYQPRESAQPLPAPPEDELPVLQEAARGVLHDDIFEKEYAFNHIFADRLYEMLSQPPIRETTFAVDIRPPAAWDATGHVGMGPHTHIAWRALGEPQYRGMLSKESLIVIVGTTGRDAGQVTPILRMLGYNAVTLRSGLTAWTTTSDSARTLEQVEGADLPVEPSA